MTWKTYGKEQSGNMKIHDLNAEIGALIWESLAELLEPEQLETARKRADSSLLVPCRNPEHGDYSANLAMKLASVFRTKPLDIANKIADKVRLKVEQKQLACERIEVVAPGFINFVYTADAYSDVLEGIRVAGEKYGRSAPIEGAAKILMEYVSANPTGPLTVAHGRQAAVGDTLANIMQAAGYDVTREYYLNDRGKQMQILARSAIIRYLQEFESGIEFPEEGYQGDYMKDIARSIKEEHGDRFVATAKSDETLDFFLEYAKDSILEMIKTDLKDFVVDFDVWFSEKAFATPEVIQKTLDDLAASGFSYEQDGAVWLKSTEFGDDKDRVLVKSTGEFTYITPDLAYHVHKFNRGFERLINLWGPDHHGYIPRIKAGLQALGYNGDGVDVLIVQLCSLFRGDEKISMSTRAGEFVSLREIIDEVGKDAARYYFLMLKPESHLNFDLQAAKAKNMDNPVFYLQYAHARICSVFDKYQEQFGTGVDLDSVEIDLSTLVEPEEKRLVSELIRFPAVIRSSADAKDPHEVIIYLQALAALFHSYYNRFRVIGDDEKLMHSRCLLMEAVRIVIRNGLALLGVDAPQSM